MLFESRVGGVALSMTASIFHFEFIGGVVVMPFGAFWKPLWILRASLGVFWGSFGDPLGEFVGVFGRPFWLLWGALGVL